MFFYFGESISCDPILVGINQDKPDLNIFKVGPVIKLVKKLQKANYQL